jgi:hypothetical protein
MPSSFEIKFSNFPPLICQLHDTALADRYATLLKTQYFQEPNPIFRDAPRYTLQYFQSLIDQAQGTLGWNWHRDQYDLETTTLLHKDIEQYLANGYENIPEEHDHLLHELHFCLHAIESGSKRNSWLQIEWFNDNGFFINEDEYPGKLVLEFGDLRLQNPYVGHHPLYLYQQQDSTNITQTCRFHDFAKPGINVVIAKTHETVANFDWDKYINWFRQHDNNFVATHGVERIKKFTGHPVVGSIVNKDDLEILIRQPVLDFESITFV